VHPIPTLGLDATVINWHVSEACNFRCGYCYAKWQQPNGQELIRDPDASAALIRALFAGLARSDARRPPRLNFAGGEPLLHAGRVVRAMEQARSRLRRLADLQRQPPGRRPRYADDAALGNAGQHADRSGASSRHATGTRPDGANWQENLHPLIEALAPSRWKVLRMLPVVTHRLAPSDAQFRTFVDQQRALDPLMCVEDNDDVVESYIMVDPHGRFFQNRPQGRGYDHSVPMLAVGVAAAFARITWSARKFESRYPSIRIEAGA